MKLKLSIFALEICRVLFCFDLIIINHARLLDWINNKDLKMAIMWDL